MPCRDRCALVCIWQAALVIVVLCGARAGYRTPDLTTEATLLGSLGREIGERLRGARAGYRTRV